MDVPPTSNAAQQQSYHAQFSVRAMEILAAGMSAPRQLLHLPLMITLTLHETPSTEVAFIRFTSKLSNCDKNAISNPIDFQDMIMTKLSAITH